MNRDQLLRRLYHAHATRDIETAIAALVPDVEWPNVAAGTVLHGHDAVRSYWADQFLAIDPSVEPLSLSEDGDEVTVTVHQVVRALDGTVLHDGIVTHTFTFQGELIAAMRVGAP